MSALRTSALVAFVPFCLGSFQPASPVEVTIRVIDARNGRPYAHLGIYVELIKRKVDPLRGEPLLTENSLGDRRAVTDLEGRATVDVTPPFQRYPEVKHDKYTLEFRARPPYYGLPEQLNFILGDGRFGCSGGLVDMSEVLSKGVVGINECRTKWAKKNVKFEAKPGEIVLFARPPSLWQQLTWP